MKFTPRCVPLWLGLALLPVTAFTSPASAAAQQQTYAFAQPAQPLAQALDAFSRATGQSVVYTLELPDAQAPALDGHYSAEQALQRLLGSTGLTWRRLDARTLTLETPALDTAGTVNLQATTVDSLLDDDTYQPPASASIMRGQGSSQDIPQAINVVPAQVIRDQAPRNLDDALTNVSGVTQGNNFGGTSDTVMKRGFGDNRDGSIMRDGMPIVQGRSLNASTERVEVLKGPASLLYGIQDPGGVINVVSKRPQREQYNALTVRGSTYGSGKNGSGGSFDSTGALGDSDLAYRLIVDHEDEDYWRNFGTHRESLVAPSLAWLGEDTQVVLAYEHREFLYPFDRGTAFGSNGHPLDIPATRRLDEPFNDMEGRSDLYRLEVDHQLDDVWKLHMGYSFNRETYDASQVRVTGVNQAAGTLTRSIDGTHNAMSRDQYAIIHLNGNVELAGMQHDLLFGVDHEDRKVFRGDLIRQTARSRFKYVDPVYGREVEGSTVRASDSDQTDKLRTDALFMQDALHLDDHWILVAGARFQQYDQYAGRGRPFSERPKVFLELLPGVWQAPGHTTGKSGLGSVVDAVGGHNIAADVIPGALGDVSVEYVLQRDPDVYIATGNRAPGVLLGAGVSQKTAQDSLARITARPEFAPLRPIQQGQAHALWHDFYNSPFNILAIEAMARWIHPERFEDLDPQATLAEINRLLKVSLEGSYWIDAK